MAVAIRGTTPAHTTVTSDPVSLTLNGTRQPNTGDVLLIIHHNDFYGLANMPTPTIGGSSAGITAVTGGSADGGANQGHAIAYTYVAPGTADITVSVDETGSADEEKALTIYVLSGVDTATPIDIAGNAVNTGTTTHICPSVDPTTADAFLICHTNTGGGAAAASYTHPSGMTESLDTATGGMSTGGATLQLSVDTATGTKTFVPNTSITSSANLSIAIKTGGAAAPAGSSAYSPARLPGRIGPDGKVFLPGVRFDNNGGIAEVTGTVTETQDNQTSAATGVLGYSGTVAETQDNQTSTATGILGYTGTSARTQADQTSTATGVLGYTGTVARAQADQTAAASGWVTVTGTVAETQDNQTSAASGTVGGIGEVTGSVAETQDNQTSAATGVLGYSGTSARTQADQTSAATGVFGYTGASARTQDNQTSAATGVLGYSGTAVGTQANQTAAAVGTVAAGITGTVARTQANQTASASGWISVTGTVARTQANQTSVATGTVTGVTLEPRTLILFSTRVFGTAGYHANENHLVFLPTSLPRHAPLVVVCHGTAAEASYYYATSERYRPLEELADDGLVVIAADLGEPSVPDGWGNDRSVTAIDEVVTWAASEYGCNITRVSLIGDSAGGATAFNWARANNDRVAGVALRAGVCDVDAVYTTNAFLATLIDAAYGGNWNAAKATHDPALNTSELTPIADRIRCYYSSGDDLIPPASTLAFCTDVGCPAIPVGTMVHSDAIAAAIQTGDLANWLWSLH